MSTIFSLFFLVNVALAQTADLDIVGVIPNDCTVTVGAAPDSASFGSLLLNPVQGGVTQSVSTPVTFSCATNQARIRFKSQNGYLKGISTGTLLNYFIAFSGGGSNVAAQTAQAGYFELYLMPSNQVSVSGNLLFTTYAQNPKPDLYQDVLTFTINAP